MKRLLISITTLLLISSCNKKNLPEDSTASLAVDPVEASVESGVTFINAMADEQSGGSLAYRSTADKFDSPLWKLLLGETAQAASCARAYYASCVNGVKSVDYNGCDVTGTSRSLSGQVTLSYSHMSCTLTSTGDSVTRTYDITINGPRGGVITHSSQASSDYRGSSYGGGGQLSKTAGGWQIDILGRHTTLNFRGRQIFNVSTRTMIPISVTGSLSRSSRIVNGGQMEVNHNLAGFTAVFTPNNLQWSNSCCHPTSGSLTVNFSGSKTGTATVTFQNSCGSAVVDQGGQQTNLQLSYCE